MVHFSLDITGVFEKFSNLMFGSHYEVTMSGTLMANYYISWRLENNVMSSKYLVMHALNDH